jgi:hypothetical protein
MRGRGAAAVLAAVAFAMIALARIAMPNMQPPQSTSPAPRNPAHERQVKLTGNAHLLISNAKGQRIGYADGRLIDEIPNARYVEQINTLGAASRGRAPEPTYLLPSGEAFSIQISLRDASPGRAGESISLSIFGGGMVFEVKRLPMHAGKRAQLLLDPSTTRFELTPAFGADLGEVGRVGAVIDATDGADYDYALTRIRLADGVPLIVAFDLPSGRLLWRGGDGAPVTLDYAVTRVDARGAASEAGQGVGRIEALFGVAAAEDDRR